MGGGLVVGLVVLVAVMTVTRSARAHLWKQLEDTDHVRGVHRRDRNLPPMTKQSVNQSSINQPITGRQPPPPPPLPRKYSNGAALTSSGGEASSRLGPTWCAHATSQV